METLRKAVVLVASGFLACFLVVMTATEAKRLFGLLGPLNHISLFIFDAKMASLFGAVSGVACLCTRGLSRRPAFAVIAVVLTLLFAAEMLAFAKGPGMPGYGPWLVKKSPQLFYGLIIAAGALLLRQRLEQQLLSAGGSQS